jgi:hypothetical protein
MQKNDAKGKNERITTNAVKELIADGGALILVKSHSPEESTSHKVGDSVITGVRDSTVGISLRCDSCFWSNCASACAGNYAVSNGGVGGSRSS